MNCELTLIRSYKTIQQDWINKYVRVRDYDIRYPTRLRGPNALSLRLGERKSTRPRPLISRYNCSLSRY